MINHDLIKKLEQLDYFPSLLKNGIIPMIWMDYKVIYEFYLEELKRLSVKGDVSRSMRRQAKQNTAEEYRICEAQVYAIIRKMKC